MEEAWRLFRVCPSVALLCLIDCCTCVCLAVMSNESAGLLGRGYAGDAAGLLFPFSKTNDGHVTTGRYVLACLLAGLRSTDKPNRASSQTGKGWGERFSRIRRARASIRLSIPRMHVHVRSSRSDGHDPRPELPSSSPAAVLQQVERSNRSWIEECPSSRCAAIRQMVQCTTVHPRKQLFVYSSSTNQSVYSIA